MTKLCFFSTLDSSADKITPSPTVESMEKRIQRREDAMTLLAAAAQHVRGSYCCACIAVELLHTVHFVLCTAHCALCAVQVCTVNCTLRQRRRHCAHCALWQRRVLEEEGTLPMYTFQSTLCTAPLYTLAALQKTTLPSNAAASEASCACIALTTAAKCTTAAFDL